MEEKGRTMPEALFSAADTQADTRCLRVLHIISTMNPAAGGPTESVRLLLSSPAGNYSGEVVTVDPVDAPYLEEYPFPVHRLGPSSMVYGYSPRLRGWLRANLHRFDIVVVNGLWQFNGLAVLLEVSGKKPYIVFSHGMLDPYFKKEFPLKHVKKWLYWVLVEYWVLRRAKYVVFTSPQEAELARQSFWLHKWNPLVVPYGADRPPELTPNLGVAFYESCPEARDRRYLLYLGRIHSKKGCDLLIEAFGKVAKSDPELCLVMAGPDQQGLMKTLRTSAATLGVADRVFWPGLLLGEAKWGSLYSAEAFILPSHQENFGIAVAEALGCGTPVLLSDKVNIAHVIAEDGAGYVESDTLQGTTSLLERWVAASAETKAAMRHTARATFENHFWMERAVTVMLDRARQLLAEPTGKKRRSRSPVIT